MAMHEGQSAVISAGLELHKTMRQRLDNEMAALQAAKVQVPVALFDQAQRALDDLSDGLHRAVLSSIGAH